MHPLWSLGTKLHSPDTPSVACPPSMLITMARKRFFFHSFRRSSIWVTMWSSTSLSMLTWILLSSTWTMSSIRRTNMMGRKLECCSKLSLIHLCSICTKRWVLIFAHSLLSFGKVNACFRFRRFLRSVYDYWIKTVFRTHWIVRDTFYSKKSRVHGTYFRFCRAGRAYQKFSREVDGVPLHYDTSQLWRGTKLGVLSCFFAKIEWTC